MKLGYADFINKHKTKAIILFALAILVLYIFPIFYNEKIFNHSLTYAMRYSFYIYSVSIVSLPIGMKKSYIYELNQHYIDSSTSFGEYFKSYIPYYVVEIIGSLIFWFTIISLIIVLVQHFKHKKICKPLLYLPLPLYIVYTIVLCAILGVAPFVGFYLAIILEVLVILYCAGFQRFPSRKPREHKPTDKERIAELERQVAELQKEKDVE